jgi:site-specific recombinase XerD
MRPPIIPDQPEPVIPDGLRRLLAACAGKGFEARRDTAMTMLLLDTGARRAELVDLKLAHMDLDVLLVLGKGRRERALPLVTRPALPWTATFVSGLATMMPRCPGCGWGCRAG